MTHVTPGYATEEFVDSQIFVSVFC